MKTLLILAGKSRRFWPLCEKPLFRICGKTLAEHQVERLKEGGCTDITLVVSAENEKAISALFPEFPLVIQSEGKTGMHRAFLEALPLFGSQPVLLVSGNDFIDPNVYKTLRTAASKKGVDGAILACKVKRYFPGGYLTVADDRIVSIVEKPGEGKEPSDLVNIVAHVHNDASVLLEALGTTDLDADDGYEQALDALLRNKHYKAVSYDGPWQAVKYPWHLLPLTQMLLEEITEPSIAKSAQIHSSAVIEGNVVIGDHVRVLPHATIVGPCYIGKHSIVGNNALVRGSSIGERCVVGYNTEVKGSVLAGPVWTHMTYLGDSVIGSNVSFGGGCMVGNLRLDEGEIFSACDGQTIATGLTKLGVIAGDDCRFGIQVGTNPGVKVGRGSFIGGGTMVNTDIPEGSFVVTKEGRVDVRENKVKAPSMEERKKYFA